MSTVDPAPTTARDAIRAIGRAWATYQYELITATVVLDNSGEWATDGAASCAHWIADVLDVEVCTAREWLRIGRLLQKLAGIDSAFADGRISYSKVRALTRLAEPANEQELLDIALRVPAGRLAHALATWLTRNETPEQTEQRHHAARSMRWRLEPDGTITIRMRLAPLAATTLISAVDACLLRRQTASATDRDRTGQWPSLAQQRHDAFIELFSQRGTKTTTEIVVHVRGDGNSLEDGTPISNHAVAQLLDRSFIRLLIHDADRRPINASGRQRHPTPRQKRVVHERHAGQCVDCGSTDLIEYDHDPPYETSGHTVIDELQPRCAVCHHRRHTHGPSGSDA